MTGLLAGVMEERAKLATPIPVFLKIAPDLSDDEIAEIAEVALATGVQAVIATNTRLSRAGLRSADKDQMGGLSGAPLFESSTRILAKLSKLSEGDVREVCEPSEVQAVCSDSCGAGKVSQRTSNSHRRGVNVVRENSRFFQLRAPVIL